MADSWWQLYNQHFDKVLDFKGDGTSDVLLFTYPAVSAGEAAKWELKDSTPKTTRMATSTVTQTTTITPPPTPFYVGGQQATVTSTSVTTETIVSY